MLCSLYISNLHLCTQLQLHSITFPAPYLSENRLTDHLKNKREGKEKKKGKKLNSKDKVRAKAHVCDLI